ncbi:hypothetical protein GCM10023322_23400 [Rugosimonospora acidiphila]|uniref:Integral membrane protein n=1 Tax=Rugosimonospora acidiphila TaxID=556531 RepID=A0ABP9RPM7_9ACTN
MNLFLKIAGVVAGLIGGFLTGLWEVFLSPLYVGAVPLPLSPVLAIVTSGALIWFTRRVTGSAGLALLPGVVWFATMLVAATETREGDVLMPGNDYIGLAAILVGAAVWAIMAYRMFLNRPSTAGGRAGTGGATRPNFPVREPAKVGPGRRPASAPAKASPAPGKKPSASAKTPSVPAKTPPAPAKASSAPTRGANDPASASTDPAPGEPTAGPGGASGAAPAGQPAGPRAKPKRPSGSSKSPRPGGRR